MYIKLFGCVFCEVYYSIDLQNLILPGVTTILSLASVDLSELLDNYLSKF